MAPDTVFCVFFGPTPMSQGDEIRPPSAVNVVGKLIGDATVWKKMKRAIEVKIEQIDGGKNWDLPEMKNRR